MENKATFKTTSRELDTLITEAVRKLGKKKENDICRFIPAEKEGYIHHFTMRKMKNEDPDQLAQLIDRHILTPANPKPVAPKPRAPRGSRKRPGQVNFSRRDMDQLLTLARKSGNRDLVRKLAPRRDLRNIKRELITTIRHARVDQELWESYVETVSAQNPEESVQPSVFQI